MTLNIFSLHGLIAAGSHPSHKREGIAMNETIRPTIQQNLPSRRQTLVTLAAAPLALATTTPRQSMKQTPATTANEKRTSLHLEIEIKAPPERIYSALLDSKQFTAFSGLPAEIDPKEGGAFSMFQGQIVGRNVELVANQRIVQAWRPAHWDPGDYSIARFVLKPANSGTTVVLNPHRLLRRRLRPSPHWLE
jgi:activator of HSP90 ATPase